MVHQQPLIRRWSLYGRMIRSAHEPDNPSLLQEYLADGERIASKRDVDERDIYSEEFRLLLDTVSDLCLPQHWRSLCLDYIYRPLNALNTLSQGNALAKKQVRAMEYELSIISHYFSADLNGSSRYAGV